jgi:hypothetical protein
MDFNPVLTEIQGLSPEAKGALQMAGHQMATPPVDPGVGQPSQVGRLLPQDAGSPPPMASPHMATGQAVPTLTAPPAPSVIGERGTVSGDTAARTSLLNSGPPVDSIYHNVSNSGFGQAHPFLGKLLGGIAEVGGKIGDTLANGAPGIAREIPGTTQNYNMKLGRINTSLTQDEANAGKEAQTANLGATTQHENAETAGLPQEQADKHTLTGATVGNLESETKDRDASAANPPLAVAYSHAVNQAIKEGRDPAQDPVVQHLSDAIVGLQPKQNLPPEAPKTIQVQINGRPHQMAFDPKTGKYDLDQGESGEKPPVVNVNAANSAIDRESARFAKPYEKGVSDANSQLEKIADARAMVNGGAEAQALGMPKVLTALVSGAGSGVRITQPELNAIAKARGLTGDIEGTLNSWAGKGKLTATQQQQLTGILDDVKARIEAKRNIHSDALDAINGGRSKEEMVQADRSARQKINDLESGAGASGQVIVKAPNGKSYPFPNQAAADKFKAEAGIK